MPVCPHCGHDTTDSAARFCAACGRSLDESDARETAAESTSVLHLGGPEPGSPEPTGSADAEPGSDDVVERLKSGTALLVVRRGPAAGARFLLDSDVTTAGRHPDSDIFLDDITVSRHHVEFRRSDAGFSICDMGSLNGTYVNRSRIDDVALVSGDEVQIGKYRLQFLTSSEQPGGQS
ncbi:MAG: FHA domain-containing protein [Actinomycetia bacterium]|nr:FHA domain-containing protein [Actinomycetes bacterium]